MKALVVAISSLTLALSVAATGAAEEAKGRIKELNPAESWFTMENGQRYHLAVGITPMGLKPGTEVAVSYEQREGKNIAVQVWEQAAYDE